MNWNGNIYQGRLPLLWTRMSIIASNSQANVIVVQHPVQSKIKSHQSWCVSHTKSSNTRSMSMSWSHPDYMAPKGLDISHCWRLMPTRAGNGYFKEHQLRCRPAVHSLCVGDFKGLARPCSKYTYLLSQHLPQLSSKLFLEKWTIVIRYITWNALV